MPEADFLPELPVERRLALSYAPARPRALWLGLFALDARLGSIVHQAREPMLGQIKLAWWREELAKPAAQRRKGEPLLELLDTWGDDAAGLARLADYWEVLLAGELLTKEAAVEAAEGRADACSALARRLGIISPATGEAAKGWAVSDLAPMLAEPVPLQWPRLSLPREMRPLQVLYGLAARQKGQSPLIPGPIAGLAAIRLGLLGI